MKNLFFLIALATTFTFFSCSDDDSATPDFFVTAQINGQSFDADQIVGVGDTSFGELLVLSSGTETSTDFAIGLNLPASTALNTSQVIEMDDLAITFADADENAFFTVGQVTISSFDTDAKIMEGTFDFVATNDSDDTDIYNVTDGAFRIQYQ